MAFPAGLKVFIEWTAGTWTDVTTDVDTSVQVQIHYGRTSTFGAAQFASLSLRLANPLGKYTPLRQVLADGVTTHPYYPNVVPRKRIKVSYTISAVEYPRFIGYIKGFPPSLENGTRAYVDIVATDIMDQLSRVTLTATMLNEITLDNPSLLWPLTDPAGSTTAVESTGSGQALTITAATDPALVFGVNGPGAGDGTAVQFNPGSVSTGQYLTTPVAGSSSTYSVECWVNAGTVLPAWGTGAGTQSIIGLGGLTGVLYLFNGAPSYEDATLPLINGPTSIADGGWHHLCFTATAGGTGTLYVDGVSVGTKTATALTSISTVTVGDNATPASYLPQRFQGNVGYVAIYPTVLSAARVAAHAAAGKGYFGDTTGARIARVLGFAGLTSANWNLDTGKAIVGTYPQNGKTVLQYCQDMAVTEGGGAVFYATPDGKARFADRTYRKPAAPVITVDAVKDLSNSTYQPSFDELTLQNESIISRSSESGTDSTQTVDNAASIAAYGLSSQGLTTYATTDQDALANGQQIVAENASPGFRYPQVGVNLLTAVNALYVAVAGVQIGSRLRLSAIPAGVAPATQADVLVEGWTETWGYDSYMWVADTSPADMPARGVWNDTTYGRWQFTPGTASLTSTITAAATSLSITTTGANQLTTTSGSYPLSIQIGQEVITLNTPPGGGTSPQAFTGVTRGTNGTPAAAQTASTAVTLWPVVTWTQ